MKNKMLRIILHDKIDSQSLATLLDEVKMYEEKFFITTVK